MWLRLNTFVIICGMLSLPVDAKYKVHNRTYNILSMESRNTRQTYVWNAVDFHYFVEGSIILSVSKICWDFPLNHKSFLCYHTIPSCSPRNSIQRKIRWPCLKLNNKITSMEKTKKAHPLLIKLKCSGKWRQIRSRHLYLNMNQ